MSERILAHHVTPGGKSVYVFDLTDGNSVMRAHVDVIEPFEAGWSITLGTDAEPESVLGPSDMDLTVSNQFISCAVVRLTSKLLLRSSGPSSNQGHAVVYVEAC